MRHEVASTLVHARLWAFGPRVLHRWGMPSLRAQRRSAMNGNDLALLPVLSGPLAMLSSCLPDGLIAWHVYLSHVSVLCYCFKGANRSAAYITAATGCSVLEAFGHVNLCRKVTRLARQSCVISLPRMMLTMTWLCHLTCLGLWPC